MCPESLAGQRPRRVGNPKHTEVSVARQSPQRPDADEPELDDTTGAAEPDEAEETDRASAPVDRSLWDELRIDPVEIALPAGTGFTLRAYRPASSLTPTDVTERDQDDPFLARRQVDRGGGGRRDRRHPRRGAGRGVRRRRRGRATRRRRDGDRRRPTRPTTTPTTDEDGSGRGGRRGGAGLPQPPGQAAAVQDPRVAGQLSSGPARRTICPNWTAGMNWPNGWSRPTSPRSTRTPTSSTWSWRTCAAGTTPGIRPC